MSVKEIVVNNCTYKIQCENGSEDHLEKLSNSIDLRVKMIASSLHGKVPDSTLLLLAALELNDACWALEDQLQKTKDSNNQYLSNVSDRIQLLLNKIKTKLLILVAGRLKL